MFPLYLASVLVSLLCFSAAAAAPAPDDCGQLTQPLTRSQRHQILGRWILIEAFSDNAFADNAFSHLESMWMRINTTADSNTLLLEQASSVRSPNWSNQGPPQPRHPKHEPPQQDQNQYEQQPVAHTSAPVEGQCNRFAQNVTLVDGEALEVHMKIAHLNLRFLQACADCLLMHGYTNETNYQAVYLFGRNTTLADSDLESSRKQATCLKFPLPAKFHYDTNNELCPM